MFLLNSRSGDLPSSFIGVRGGGLGVGVWKVDNLRKINTNFYIIFVILSVTLGSLLFVIFLGG